MEHTEPFGPALRLRRMAGQVSLAELARRTHYSKSYLSRVETGARPPTAALAQACDAGLSAGGALRGLIPPAGAPGVPPIRQPDSDDSEGSWLIGMGDDGSMWFQPTDRRQALALGAAMVLPMAVPAQHPAGPTTLHAQEAVDVFSELFPQLRRLGQRTSPSAVLPTLIVQTRTLHLLADQAQGRARTEAYLLASRYAEYAGWMAQEAGRDDMAMWWTAKAVALAKRGGDVELAAYGLVRYALIRMYAGDALSTVALAEQAENSPAAGNRVRGLAALRQAQGHALAGSDQECWQALERARTLLAEPPEDGRPAWGSVSGGDPAELITAGCLYDLGRPAEAAGLLDRELPAIPTTARRLRTRWAARQILAHAAAGNIDHACALATALLPDFTATASQTIRLDLMTLTRLLARWRGHPAVRELTPHLTSALLLSHPMDRTGGSR